MHDNLEYLGMLAVPAEHAGLFDQLVLQDCSLRCELPV